MRIASGLITILLAAACSTAQPEPAPPPQLPAEPPPAPPLPKQPSGKWIDWPVTPGEWVYRSDTRGSLALFGRRNNDAMLTIRCDAGQRRIYISRIGRTASQTQMTFRASSGLQSHEARDTGGGEPQYTAVSMAPDDLILDRIAFSRGRFAIETTGLQSLAIPVWPEFTRVVEDCRR